MSKKIDLRVKRTRESIRNAFFTLMKLKAYNKISVQDIASEAYINRNTFYLHYIDKDDLLDQLIDETFKEFENGLNSDDVSGIDELDYDSFKRIMIRSFEAIENNIKFYEIIFLRDDIPYLNTKFENLIRNHISLGKTSNSKGETADETKFYAEYLTVGLVGSIKFWVKNRANFSIEKMADMMIDIYSKDVLKILKNEN